MLRKTEQLKRKSFEYYENKSKISKLEISPVFQLVSVRDLIQKFEPIQPLVSVRDLIQKFEPIQSIN